MPNTLNYIPSHELINAYHIAKTLNKPLLLTGKPGCGKTTFAQWVLNQIQEKKDDTLYTFYTKSTSQASDLFYYYNTMGQFIDSRTATSDEQVKDARDNSKYIISTALGAAIESANHGNQTVVLIDEIDKAPRDFPNDLLNEIEHYNHNIKEAPNDTRFKLTGKFKPIIIITSNSEKNLPDAFLRRCVFHHIEQTVEDVLSILKGKFDPKIINSFEKDIKLVYSSSSKLRKEVSLAELEAALQCLKEDNPFKTFSSILPMLCKNKEDEKTLREVIK